MKAKDIIKMLEKDGWYSTGICNGSHKYYKHPTKKGKITVPIHSSKELKKGTLSSILKQSGLK